MLVVNGAYRGLRAILEALDTAKFCVSVRIDQVWLKLGSIVFDSKSFNNLTHLDRLLCAVCVSIQTSTQRLPITLNTQCTTYSTRHERCTRSCSTLYQLYVHTGPFT